MDRGWYLRLATVVAVCGICVYLLYPSYYYFFDASPAQRDSNAAFCKALPSWASCSRFNLGLDLQGGVHLVLGVEVDKAVEQRADRIADSLRDGFKDKKFAYTSIDRPRDSGDIIVHLADKTDAGKVERYLRRNFSVLQVNNRKGQTLDLALTDKEADYVKTTAVEQTIKAIRNRADKLGVTEPTIARRGTDAVLIQLPGVKNPQRAIDLIGKTAQLEFKIVDEDATHVFDSIDESKLPDGVKRHSANVSGPAGKTLRDVYFTLPDSAKKKLLALLSPLLPSTREVVFGPVQEGGGQESKHTLRSYVVHERPGITGDYLTNAEVEQNPELPSDYYVTMKFDPKGAKIFAKLTEKNVQRRMAIVLDGNVNSAPVIQEKIGGGTARITLGGGFGDARSKYQQAKDLALVLKAGALPAPVQILEKRQVGKTLGADSVHKGSMAIALGAILVVVFMIIYYKLSGLIADIALILNVLMILAALALFDATLTLPGMAGIVLTIGMAVDANVIIFERIREELRIGKTPRAAIDSGYGKAFSTIFDSNVTTLIAGVVLMEYGSGPVRGFAVTLIIGILASMFTAIVVTRIIYDFFTSRRRLRSLSI